MPPRIRRSPSQNALTFLAFGRLRSSSIDCRLVLPSHLPFPEMNPQSRAHSRDWIASPLPRSRLFCLMRGFTKRLIDFLPRSPDASSRAMAERDDRGARDHQVILRRPRAEPDGYPSAHQRSISWRLKRHSPPTRKPGSCFLRSKRYTVVGCTRRYSASSATFRTS